MEAEFLDGCIILPENCYLSRLLKNFKRTFRALRNSPNKGNVEVDGDSFVLMCALTFCHNLIVSVVNMKT